MSGRRLISIDMLRGIASLVVVLFHACFGAQFVGPDGTPWWLGLGVARVLSLGGQGVTLFFIISGFCIHLRRASAVARGLSSEVDFLDFWRRRFYRLYPTYLVALAIYLLIPKPGTAPFRATWFGLYDVGSHLLMVHNFDARTAFSIEPVFWTLAIEEQLYLLYFGLWALRKRFGWGWTLAACLSARVFWFAVVYAAKRATGGFELSYEAGSLSHWFTWALGAVCIEAALGIVTLPRWCGRLSLAGLLGTAACLCDYASRTKLGGGLVWRATWLVADPLWGVAFFVVVNRVVAAEKGWKQAARVPAAVAVLARLGLFSYSTYLMHDLVLERIAPPLLHGLGLGVNPWHKLMLTPLCLAVSWAFFWCFERPFLPTKPAPVRLPVAAEATA